MTGRQYAALRRQGWQVDEIGTVPASLAMIRRNELEANGWEVRVERSTQRLGGTSTWIVWKRKPRR